ncbi:MAG: DUF3393 domain-containing protein [Gammaproteobacteria bacterium]|jgi:membrane-bound lytic murein transglycosylase C|nr:DUF3393 domain-containing protein [Gammaproteobacteria bacterium]MBT5202015.1 DUF3393 domain-containing protein [Gammaproteobacteria bacterium]MBT5600740.1 DUF3393 domain-containing protein [Gammaproteobacteria bacterium]MBT6243913.1 DUF3393 domain-containing protein [Gammaproteobacteria bacterium]
MDFNSAVKTRSAFLLGTLLAATILGSVQASDFHSYPDDVVTLLEEYQQESDSQGSTIPSVLALQSDANTETVVDFDNGIIVVTSTSTKQLETSIIEVLLTQIDPSVIDASTAIDFGLVNEKTGKPFFYKQILDHTGEPIEFEWRAQRFAQYLVNQSQRINNQYRATIRMISEHKAMASDKYQRYVQASSFINDLSPALVMAIIETESAFNPLARSRSNALGLMQIKPDTAGRDYFTIVKGYAHTPTSSYLYNPKNNIEVGTAYLRILAERYLIGIDSAQKMEYAIISSYNGGSGNLWLSLNSKGNKKQAIARINTMSVSEFYWFLTNRHRRHETRNYLKKVNKRIEKYRHL